MSTTPQHVRDNVRARLEDFRARFAENKKAWDQKREYGNSSNRNNNQGPGSSLDAYTAPEDRTSRMEDAP